MLRSLVRFQLAPPRVLVRAPHLLVQLTSAGVPIPTTFGCTRGPRLRMPRPSPAAGIIPTSQRPRPVSGPRSRCPPAPSRLLPGNIEGAVPPLRYDLLKLLVRVPSSIGNSARLRRGKHGPTMSANTRGSEPRSFSAASVKSRPRSRLTFHRHEVDEVTRFRPSEHRQHLVDGQLLARRQRYTGRGPVPQERALHPPPNPPRSAPPSPCTTSRANPVPDITTLSTSNPARSVRLAPQTVRDDLPLAALRPKKSKVAGYTLDLLSHDQRRSSSEGEVLRFRKRGDHRCHLLLKWIQHSSSTALRLLNQAGPGTTNRRRQNKFVPEFAQLIDVYEEPDVLLGPFSENLLVHTDAVRPDPEVVAHSGLRSSERESGSSTTPDAFTKSLESTSTGTATGRASGPRTALRVRAIPEAYERRPDPTSPFSAAAHPNSIPTIGSPDVPLRPGPSLVGSSIAS